MAYQYKGALPVEVETSLERELELIREAEQKAWDAAEAARKEAARVARENQALRQQLSDQWRRKRNAQARARRLRDKLAEGRKAQPKPEPADTLPSSFGGREGLEAACREVARFEARRRQERKAA
jgi:dsDNA-specific endonuclease/ATPase MutS2